MFIQYPHFSDKIDIKTTVQGHGLCLVSIPDFQVELKLFMSNYWTFEEW